VISEYTKWMEGAGDALETHKKEAGADAKAGQGDDSEDDPDEADDDFVEEDGVEEFADIEPEIKPEVEKAWYTKLWEKIAGPSKTPLEKAQDASKLASDKARDARKRIAELEGKVSTSLDDEDALAYAGLDGRCISKSIGEYTYEICFFKDAKQDSTSVGRWKKWESSGVAIFDDGQYCPGGPARSLKIIFECGAGEEIMDVSEPSRCTYQASMTHPAACTQAALTALEKAKVRMPKDEL